MPLYKFTRVLIENGFVMIKHYPNREIWGKGEKVLTIPVKDDMVQNCLAKELLAQLN